MDIVTQKRGRFASTGHPVERNRFRESTREMHTAAIQNMAISEAPTGEAWPEFNVQIVYEDLSSGLRAKQTADWLEAQLPPRQDMRLNMWRFDLLNEPAFRVGVANEAVRADVVLLSAHGQHGLPEDVSVWIREWLGQHADDPPAFVILFDASAEGTPKLNELLVSLRRAAEPAGVQIFPRFYDTFSTAEDATMEGIHHRAETTTSLLAEMLTSRRSKPLRNWGINE
jgi:hypothetical protein